MFLFRVVTDKKNTERGGRPALSTSITASGLGAFEENITQASNVLGLVLCGYIR
jgi:hypothetical protein